MSGAPAYRADGAPVSRETFYALACDPRRSVVVEACAGAGKTWMLVSRIVRALLDGAQPQEILAITFTRKAAGEMRDRLDQWLREFAAPTLSADDREAQLRARGVPAVEAARLGEALAGLQRRVLDGGRAVEVRTFHAWFAQLLRAAPYELLDEIGIDPDGELLQDLADHRSEVMRRFHAALLREPARCDDHTALIASRGRSQAGKWFDAVLARRVELELADREGSLEDAVAPAVAAGEPEPRAELCRAAWRDDLSALAVALARGGKKAAGAAVALERALAIDAAEARFDVVWAALFTKDAEPRQLGEVDGLAATQRALEALAVRQHQHDCHLEHARMVRLSRVLLAEYAAYKRERGLLDMNDLERGALALLRDASLSGWVQERLDARIRHVLIDEFQDTSPLQWHALHAWLSGYAGAGGGASGQRPPSVFVVGDPKQSIYRFRRAEPRVFGAVREFVVEALGGCVLECDHTRRNVPGVLNALNAVFHEAQQAGEFGGYRAHTSEVEADAEPALFALPRVSRPPSERRAAPAETAPWRDSLTQARHEPETERREQEAQQVAEAIQQQLDEGVDAGDIMVLSRKRAPLRLLAQALKQRHIAHVAVDDASLIEAPEAQDLVAVLDALVSPQHRLSLARALRSPLFDASDDDLLELSQRAEPSGDWWQALLDHDGGSAALQRAKALMAGWQEAARGLPPHDLLDRIVAQGELRERLAARVPAAQRATALAHVDALLAQALELDGGRYATPYGFVRALKRRTITVPAPDLGGAVRLLTVHGAKGLEADVVFVMDADPEPPQAETATLLVDWPVQADAPRRCAFLYSEGRCPLDLAGPLDEERRSRRREELNGLYVAMTRARRRLVFSATQPRPRQNAPASWWQRIEAVASPWPAQPAVRSEARVEPPPLLDELPRWSGAPSSIAPRPRQDSAASRLGQAVHRVLEWHGSTGGEPARLAEAAAAEFGAPVEAVARVIGRILASPECARFFDPSALRWAGNEVPVSLDGTVLRIDRLVRMDEQGVDTWWVLDYKLQHRPEELSVYHDQLAAYRAAVRQAQPGARVRSAFIAGDGRLIESA
ncbi:exodeoxyribonuclease V subunit beta [uncultured Piscinibacter sp.]|uniref:UvrD-helicase domain-containing protein n=1 Tax=uncultured Piscinibacter sp. TaxID=1131835 RepID=UPI002623DD85|nr:UvrD-helicase domain-containing protein [uncultured Piscinibacter sp.]